MGVLSNTNGFLLSLSAAIISIAVGWVFIPWLIRQEITRRLIISEDRPDVFAAWVDPPFSLSMEVYVFNVTNPEEVQKGGLPKLVEVGPYVFHERRTKVNYKSDEETDTITYGEHLIFHFDRERTAGRSLEDVVTIVNVPYVAAALAVTNLPWPMNDLGKMIIVNNPEPAFVQRTVDELLFKGWKVPLLNKIEDEVGLSLLPNNTFSLFTGKNDSVEGPFTILRGTRDPSQVGKVLRFKNSTELSFWNKGSSCNHIKGTDGRFFGPFIDRKMVLDAFLADVCRSTKATYAEDGVAENIPVYRFRVPESEFISPTVSEENSCYCSSIDDEPEKCLKHGAMDMAPCRDGAPVAISLPHFLWADDEYTTKSGLSATVDKYGSYVDLEPTSGVAIQASSKLQANLVMKPVKGIRSLSKLPDKLFPLIWANENGKAHQEIIDQLKTILTLVKCVELFGKWGLPFLVTVVALVFATRYRKAKGEPGSLSICIPLKKIKETRGGSLMHINGSFKHSLILQDQIKPLHPETLNA